jgi:cytoskeletal protein CcmA (bactofilin family)
MAIHSKDAGTDANTVIGESILIKGKLEGDEDLTVRGRVEGEITLQRTLIVEQSGVVKADVSVRNAVVSGAVVGNINASESVEITAEGRMVGDIKAPRVIIVDGAAFRGRVDMGDLNAERPRGDRPVVRAATSTSRPIPRPLAPPSPAKTEEKKGEEKRAKPPAVPPKPPLALAGAKRKVVVKHKK